MNTEKRPASVRRHASGGRSNLFFVSLFVTAIALVSTSVPAQDLLRLSRDTVYDVDYRGMSDTVMLTNLGSDTLTIDSFDVTILTAGMVSYVIDFQVEGFGGYSLFTAMPADLGYGRYKPVIRIPPASERAMIILNLEPCPYPPLAKAEISRATAQLLRGDTIAIALVFHAATDHDTLVVRGIHVGTCPTASSSARVPTAATSPMSRVLVNLAGRRVSTRIVARSGLYVESISQWGVGVVITTGHPDGEVRHGR